MASSYFNQLYQASYNGAQFFVYGADSQFGRRVADHRYPFRDTPWAEDIGRKPREFVIHGYIVGDDVIAQRDWMVTVCELAGPGVLIHPTMGILNVSCVNLSVQEKAGRSMDLTFTFVEAGQRLFPSLNVSTANAVLDAIGNVNSSAGADFASQVTDAVAKGATVVTKGVVAATSWASIGEALVKNATNIFHLGSSLKGNYGRFAGGRTGSSSGSILGAASSVGSIATQLAGLVAFGSAARAAVATSATNVTATAGGL
jgi:prophage DNA circulation protein